MSIRVLSKSINYSNDKINDILDITNVEFLKREKRLIFYFQGENPIDVSDMKDITNAIASAKMDEIDEFDYHFTFDNYDEQKAKEYYKFIVERLSLKYPTIISASDYSLSYEDEKLIISVPEVNQRFMEFVPSIRMEYAKHGFLGLEIECVGDNNLEEIRTKIENENKEAIAKAMKKMEKTQEYIVLRAEKDFYGVPLDLQKYPRDEDSLNVFRAEQRKSMYIVQGIVRYYDRETFEAKGNVKFIISDGVNYVSCNLRKLQNKDEAKFFRKLDLGMHAIVQGYPEFNSFTQEVTYRIVNMKLSTLKKPITTRSDDEPVKRVELHLHTKMSSLDAVPEMTEYLEAAKIFGHKAIAVTDHSSVQSFHDLHDFVGKNPGFKPIYGVELNFVDQDLIQIAYDPQPIDLHEATYVAFDIETTGFSTEYERIIEIGAIKYKNGIKIAEFSELIDPEKEIPPVIVGLTGISNAAVVGKRTRKAVLKDFNEFIKGSILIAHNAEFDMSHIYKNLETLRIEHERFPVIDTLMLSKVLVPGRRGYGLDPMSKYYKVKLESHHRATDDAEACGEIYLHLMKEEGMKNITLHSELNSLLDRSLSYKYPFPNHINIIAKTQKGLYNLYHMLSIAGTEYCTSEAVLTKDVLDTYKEGIIVGSGCRNSVFFDTFFRKGEEAAEKIVDLYDFIEIQPQNTFEYMKNHYGDHVHVYRDTVRRLYNFCKKHNKLLCATGDCHQVNKEDIIYRDILVHTDPVGGQRKHYLRWEQEIPAEYYMTTKEMLDEFQFLGKDIAYEIVVTNTNKVADMIEDVKSFVKTPYPPADDFMKRHGIPSAEEFVKETCYKKAEELYGDPLPGMVLDRVNNELDNICKNKFSTIYLISRLMVYKSREDGFVVGSRGSVGSSFAAHLMDITEVNSLPPHYRCPHCHFSSFKMLPEEKTKYGVREEEAACQAELDKVLSGYDLPDMNCPVCGTLLEREGQDIPFETFLGVPEDPKTPDIDLNFSGLNQSAIHNYIRDLFGQTKAFRAGTILTCKEKTAYAIVRDYFELENEERKKHGLDLIEHTKAEMEALSTQITGNKRSSSQHPGGIVVVPIDHEIWEVTPVQYPGDSSDRSWMTTHFDYHQFEKNLFKLDVLGHDDPTVLRYLMQYVEKYPDLFPFKDAFHIPVNDHNLFMLMNNTEIIGCKPEEIESSVATYGISEFGTPFVRGLLEKAKPTTFSELLKVSGLSHGTDVWANNADLLLVGEAKTLGTTFPKIPFKQIIGCRDDIMTDLISYGVPAPLAFNIMEFVRKGKPSKDEEKWNSFLEKLNNYPAVPDWYKWSCGKIKYMFPKAHATAYVVMALRIAWFKLYQPIFFYSALMANKMTAWDIEIQTAGPAAIKQELDRLKNIPQNERKPKEEDLITTLELALEMTVRGMRFLPVDLEHSLAKDFLVSDDLKGLYMPYCSIDGLGEAAGNSIVDARKEKMFSTKADFIARTKVSSTLVKRMEEMGVFDGIPDDNQLTLDLWG